MRSHEQRGPAASDETCGRDSHNVNDDLLSRVRNMWQFANLCQWIYIFGSAAKINDDIDIEKIETECVKPDSPLLMDLALALLKFVSSHRGLTPDILDDQLRKQYLAKAPQLNPFGESPEPRSFKSLDVCSKIRVLQQLTQWAMIHPERLREKMEEHKDMEQTEWRIEPYGWDRYDRTYYVLDDNRVYRLTEPPVVQPRAKSKKKSRAGRRSSQKNRCNDQANDISSVQLNKNPNEDLSPDDSLDGKTWECLAVTLKDVMILVEGLAKTRDDNEKVLRTQLNMHLVPILEKQEEAQRQKQIQRERELINLEKMANAKRSSRIAGRLERQKEIETSREQEQQRKEAEVARQREEREQLRLSQARDFRMFSRKRRLQEREIRRKQHKEGLAQLSEATQNAPSIFERTSQRAIHMQIERSKQALKDIDLEEEDWIFDCTCGLYGQVDDGSHSLACERCNVWQHSRCLGIEKGEAERSDFKFVCRSCQHQDTASDSSVPSQDAAPPSACPAMATTTSDAEASSTNLTHKMIVVKNGVRDVQSTVVDQDILTSPHSTATQTLPASSAVHYDQTVSWKQPGVTSVISVEIPSRRDGNMGNREIATHHSSMLL